MTLRLGALLLATAAVCALAWAQTRTGDLVLYNHSKSMPVGLYLRSADTPTRGAIVTIRARDAAPEEAARRGYQGRFLKRVAAIGGDHVCSVDGRILVNGRVTALQRARDASGRRLQVWTGCVHLDAGKILLLGEAPDSFDGRYWGPTERGRIEGVWRKIL